MKLRRPKTPTQTETIVALIDVVFFLLVFFMLIGRMDATAPFEVTPPVALSGRDMPTGGITLSVSEMGQLALNGTTTTKDNIVDQFTEHLKIDPQLRLRINAHHAAELRHILPLIDLGEKNGFRDVVLVVSPDATLIEAKQ